MITEDPNANNNNNVSLLSLDEPPASTPSKLPKTDSAEDLPADEAAAAAAVQVVVVKQKSNGGGGKAAVELPPIKKSNTFYDDEVVNDQRFANLFESLTGNFFTDAFGRHPLIA